MHLVKSAHPIAPAISNGSLSPCQMLDPTERETRDPAPLPLASKAEAEPGQSRESAVQDNQSSPQNSPKDIAASKVVLMNPAPKRRQYAYLIPFTRLREHLGFKSDDEQPVVLSLGRLQEAVRTLLRAVYVDEEWYRKQYPDVAEAVAKGVFRSAKHHFIESGYFEGRRPARVVVDEEWYIRAYPDVAESIEFGEMSSCQEHFDRYGEREGRLPAQD